MHLLLAPASQMAGVRQLPQKLHNYHLHPQLWPLRQQKRQAGLVVLLLPSCQLVRRGLPRRSLRKLHCSPQACAVLLWLSSRTLLWHACGHRVAQPLLVSCVMHTNTRYTPNLHCRTCPCVVSLVPSTNTHKNAMHRSNHDECQ